MQIIQEWKRRHTWQAQAFADSRTEINAANAATLKTASLILVAACTGAWLVSFFAPSFHHMQLPYGLWWAAMCIFCVCSQRAIRAQKEIRGYLYTMFTSMFLFTIYLSVVSTPMVRASIFLGLLPATPLLILDKPRRVNGYLCAMTLLHTVLSFLAKSSMAASEDALNSAILLVLGIFVGESVRTTHLRNFELQQQAQALSELDFLTGLHNRRKMYELMQQSTAEGQPLTGVLLLDIDHFKDYNDHYGHQAGDACLRQIGKFLLTFGTVHGLEMFRFGGEEFIGFSFSGDQAELAALADALRQGIFDLAIPHAQQETGRVSVSVGYCAGTAPVRQMISAADQALYQAKSSGRNRCQAGVV